MYLPVPDKVTDLNPNAFSAGAGNAQTRALLTEFDVFPRNEMNGMFLRHSDRNYFKTLLTSMGFVLPNSKDGFSHFEKPWDQNNITVDAVITAAVGAGQSQVVSLAAADHYASSQTSGGAALFGSAPIADDRWEILTGPNAGIQVHIVSKDITTVPAQHRLTVQPVNAAVNLNGTLGAGAVLQWVGNAHAEGTGLPAAQTPRVIRYQNEMQIVKTTKLNSGSALTIKTVFGEGGQNYDVAVSDRHFKAKHMQACSNALLWGEPTTNTNITGTSPLLGYDVQVRSTEGLIQSLELYAQEDTYALGGFLLDDFDALSGLLLAQWSGGNSYMTLEGHGILTATENVLIDSFDQNLAHQIAQDAFYDERLDYSGDAYLEPKDYVAKYGYRAVKKGGCTYFFCVLPEFTKATGAGATGSAYPNWRLVLPLNFDAMDLDGNSMPAFGYRYQSLGNLNREMIYGVLNGAGTMGPVVNEHDLSRAFFVSDIGFHAIALNQFAIQRPA